MKSKNQIPVEFSGASNEDAYWLEQVRRVRQEARRNPDRRSIDERDREYRKLLDDILND